MRRGRGGKEAGTERPTGWNNVGGIGQLFCREGSTLTSEMLVGGIDWYRTRLLLNVSVMLAEEVWKGF